MSPAWQGWETPPGRGPASEDGRPRSGRTGPDPQPHDVEALGRRLRKRLATGQLAPSAAAVELLMLGQCGTARFGDVLTGVASLRGQQLHFREGHYNTLLQDLALLREQGGPIPEVLLLLPWNPELVRPSQLESPEFMAVTLAHWQHVWRLAAEAGIPRLIQVGYDWMSPGPCGGRSSVDPGGAIHWVRQANAQLRRMLPPGACFVDPDDASGMLGRARFYDPRNYFWTRSPYSTEGLLALGEAIYAGLGALLAGPRKVLVVDLDDTLWGGTVGELGPAGIRIGGGPEGDAFLHFQQYLLGLRQRGVLLAVCSKNNLADAHAPFLETPEMLLRLEDFAAFKANWRPKHENLVALSEALHLGLDSFIFFDDSRSEQELVRQMLPQVAVVPTAGEPSAFVAELERGRWFETTGSTEEDRHRADHYLAQQQRDQVRLTTDSLETYWASLDLSATLAPLAGRDLPRLVQLLARTNQFNMTTRRHSGLELERLLAEPGALGFAIRLRDRFGAYGLVGLILAIPDPSLGNGTLRLDSFLISCRALGRTLEHLMLAQFRQRALEAGYPTLVAPFVPTPRNLQLAGFWEDLGGMPMDPPPGQDGPCFRIDLTRLAPPRTFVRLEA